MRNLHSNLHKILQQNRANSQLESGQSRGGNRHRGYNLNVTTSNYFPPLSMTNKAKAGSTLGTRVSMRKTISKW